jgi:predicted dehydrogenase
MANNEGTQINRRSFMKAGGAVALAGMSARSYARILGANDRIRIAQLGCGGRSHGHVHMVQLASSRMPVETMAVCDIWSVARERRAAQVKAAFNLEPKMYKYSEEMLANKDIDGVMIATGDFQHAKLCTEVVRAGKDCYVEKPFANVLSEAKEARDATRETKQVVQMGTQHRSQKDPIAVRDIIRSGKIGKVVTVEQEWSVNQERWRFVDLDTGNSPEMEQDRNMEWKSWLYGRKSKLLEEDTDWKRWLLGKPDRPFDPHLYLEFRLYKDFSAGIFDQWLSHGSDMVHLWMDETHPVSVMASGGVFAWPDERQNPDTCIAAVVYPKGFLYNYKTTFGNSYRSFTRIQGRDGTITCNGVEGGAHLYAITREGNRSEYNDGTVPTYASLPLLASPDEDEHILRTPGAPVPSSRGLSDDDVDHMVNWLTAMQARRDPDANVDHGFSHAVVCIMAAQSYWSGKRLYWDAKSEEIVEQMPVA